MNTTISTETNYEKQALDILREIGANFAATCVGLSFPPWADKGKNSKPVYCYRFTLGKAGKFYDSLFYGSIHDAEKRIQRAGAYDVLACLTKHNPGMFIDWCAELGYDSDSMKAFEAYKATCEEYAGLRKVFSIEELEKLAEII